MTNLIHKVTKYNKKETTPPSTKSCRNECATFFSDTRTWKNGYHNLSFGHLSKQLKTIDDFISQTYSPDIYWDASHATVPTIMNNKYKGIHTNTFVMQQQHIHKIIKQIKDGRRGMLNVTQARMTNKLGFIVGKTKWLPNGSEGFIYQIPHIASYIAKLHLNAKSSFNNVYEKNNQIFLKDYYTAVNIDNATQIEYYAYRNALHFFIKKILKIPLDQQYWCNDNSICINESETETDTDTDTNTHFDDSTDTDTDTDKCTETRETNKGITFDFSTWNLELTQEGFHIVIRMEKKGFFRYIHSDGKYLRKNVMWLYKCFRIKYEYDTHTPVFYDEPLDPYYLLCNNKQFEWMQHDEDREKFKKCVHLIWKMDDTRCLNKRFQYKNQINKLMDNTLLRKRIIQLFNIPHKRWVPAMLGVNFLYIFLHIHLYYFCISTQWLLYNVSYDLWFAKRQDDLYYQNIQHLKNDQKPSIIKIPVFSLGFSERLSLILYVHHDNIKEFDNSFLEPYVCAFEISCRWESQCFALRFCFCFSYFCICKINIFLYL